LAQRWPQLGRFGARLLPARVAAALCLLAAMSLLATISLLGAGMLASAVRAETAVVAGAPAVPTVDLVRGSPDAVVGGTFRVNQRQQPQVLHPLNATDLYGNQILDLIYDTLATVDVDSLRHLPLIAESWELSPDKKTFTFHLNPKATWQDGQPVTAADVKFSYDALFDPKLRTRAKWESYFGQFTGATVVDAHTVRFAAKRDHFLNFINLAGLRIIPQHAYGSGDPNETPLAKQPMGSGPYAFQAWNRGQSIVLKRNEAYWARALPQNVGRYNSNRLLYRFISADKVSLESFKRGDLDLIDLTPEQWFRETPAPEFEPASLGPGPGRRTCATKRRGSIATWATTWSRPCSATSACGGRWACSTIARPTRRNSTMARGCRRSGPSRRRRDIPRPR
jgi:ABC-type transport system substrate-binding protein